MLSKSSASDGKQIQLLPLPTLWRPVVIDELQIVVYQDCGIAYYCIYSKPTHLGGRHDAG